MSGLSPITNIAKRWTGASQTVVNAIQSASATTGVSFDYLMDKARQESSFNPTAKASTSSASGLFQFIESTWLSAVKSYGDQFGLGNLSAKISTDAKGRPVVTDAAVKKQILELRQDPQVASNMVAAMTKDNASYLENSLGGKVGETDLYMAHFLGLGGADKFLKARQENPMASAADLFPAAAKANKNVFYTAQGGERSLDDVYAFFAGKMGEGTTPNPVVDNTAVTGTVTAQAVMQKPTYQVPALLEQHQRIESFAAIPDEVKSQLSLIEAVNWGQRQMLETMISGMRAFGVKDRENSVGGKLLSPYTAFVMSKLNSPDEKTRSSDTMFG